MAILNFPDTAGKPTDGSFIYEENNIIYVWDGVKWQTSSETNPNPTFESINGGQLAGLRNQLINPGMEISQRYGLNNLQTTANDFAVDRWRCTDGTNYSQQNSTDNWADGFNKHVLINTTGTATLYQHVELPYAGCPVPFGLGTTWTLSGYFAGNGSSIDVQPWVVFTDGLNGTGNQSTVYFPAATTINSPTSKLVRAEWTFDVGVNPNPSNTSLSVFFICTNTGGSASISGCQLEPGPVATPLEQRPIGMELSLCQRYYEIIADAYFTGRMVGTPTSQRYYRGEVYFRTNKRVNPDITNGALSYRWGGATRTDISVINRTGLPEFAMLEFDCASGGNTNGLALELNVKDLAADAEL